MKKNYPQMSQMDADEKENDPKTMQKKNHPQMTQIDTDKDKRNTM